jgi:hypothetical protein
LIYLFYLFIYYIIVHQFTYMTSLQLYPSASDVHGIPTQLESAGTTLDNWWQTVAIQLRTLQPNRQIFLDAAPAAATTIVNAKGKPAASVSSSSSATASAVPAISPRYSLWILDAALDDATTATQLKRGCKAAVLVLPQGRESEWQFRSIPGGNELARQHEFSRVIFVALNRGHEFSDLASVQKELQPILRLLSPSSPPLESPMAVVCLGPDVGARRSVAREASSSAGDNGGWVEVEDVLVDGHVHRRMLFGGGGGLVQSEARLNVPTNYLTMTSAQRKARAKKKKQAAKKKIAMNQALEQSEPHVEGDDDGIDEEEASAATVSTSSVSSGSSFSVSPSASLICYNFLPCEYQHGLLAMLSLWCPPSPSILASAGAASVAGASTAATPVSAGSSEIPSRAVLVGLGGGSLAMFLHKSFPNLILHVVELDPSVRSSAYRFFGFEENISKGLICHIEDGLTFIENLALTVERKNNAGNDDTNNSRMKQFEQQSQLSTSSPLPSLPQDLLIFDVNNVDLAEGLSFPPAPFLSHNFLLQVRNALVPESGIALWNLGCRNDPLREQLLSSVANVFKYVFLIKPDETHVNCIIAATDATYEEGDDIATAGKDVSIPHISWLNTMARLNSLKEEARSSSFHWDDEMELKSMIARMQRVSLTKESNNNNHTITLHDVFPAQKIAEETND